MCIGALVSLGTSAHLAEIGTHPRLVTTTLDLHRSQGAVEEWRSGGVEELRDGGWRGGGVKSGKVEGWRVERWRDKEVEGWRGIGVEGGEEWEETDEGGWVSIVSLTLSNPLQSSPTPFSQYYM